MDATSQAPRRKDAQRNREAILCAARELFAESVDVPMYEVSRRAGVGQATLYRNFPERTDLAAAVIAEEFEKEERLADEYAGDPDALFVVLNSVMQNMARFHGLVALVREHSCLNSPLEEHRRRLAELLRCALRDAKAAGSVRRDLTVDDIFLVLSMLRGALEGAATPAARATAASRALTLVLDGIAPSAG